MMGKCISTELFLTLSLTIAFSHSVKVEFYEMRNYEGPKHDTTSSPACANLPSYFTKVNGSIRTDGCIMVFYGNNCKLNSLRIRPESPYLSSLSYSFPDGMSTDFYVRSFRDCNMLESDQKINVDIYNQPYYKGDPIQFRDLCKCQNLPRSTHGKELSANNHGNCFTVYTKSNCKGDIEEIPGGQHYTTDLLQGCLSKLFQRDNWCIKLVRLTELKSISPCGHLPQHCLGLNAVIYSIEPLDDFTLDPYSVKDFAMTGSGVFRNSGPNTMTERYSAELEVAETKQFEFSESLRTLNSFTVEAGYMMKTKAGAPGVAEVEVEKHIKVALSHERENSRTDTETSSTQKTKRFSVSKDIEIAPCTEQEVYSFVEVASNVEVNYRVLFKVTGTFQNITRLNATEVRKRLTQFTFVREEDEYTVIAETTAKFKTTFGIKTNTNSTGRRIPNCDFYSSANLYFHSTSVFMQCLLFCSIQLFVANH